MGQLHARGPVKRKLGRVRNELLGFRRRLRHVAPSGLEVFDRTEGGKLLTLRAAHGDLRDLSWFCGLDVQRHAFAGQSLRTGRLVVLSSSIIAAFCSKARALRALPN